MKENRHTLMVELCRSHWDGKKIQTDPFSVRVTSEQHSKCVSSSLAMYVRVDNQHEELHLKH